MHKVDQLCRLDRPFHLSPEREELFWAAMGEAYQHHYQACEKYRHYCRHLGYDPAQKAEQGPWMFVNVFKRYELLSVPSDEVVLHVTSSGTSGQKSQIFFDQVSLNRIQTILESVFDEFGLVDPDQAVNYLIFSYDPQEAPDLGTAFTSTNWTRFTAHGEVVYAIRKREGAFQFAEEEALVALKRFAAQSLPVRIIGFPSFLYRLLERQPQLRLPAGSRVLTGGGWKSYADQAVPKAQFLKLLEQQLGIPPQSLRDNFGMVEHGPPYVECEHHRFHVPVFCRALIREPLTLKPLPLGEVGLLHLLTPYQRAVPNHSLLTTDLARLESGCPCGRNAPVLTIEGRGGTRKHVGCAIAAAQILRRVS